eukprot:3578636-Prymnesium_polylepis.1
MTTPAAAIQHASTSISLRDRSVYSWSACTPGRCGATARSASARLSTSLSCSTLSTRAAAAARC